jgi:hypothetical protein
MLVNIGGMMSRTYRFKHDKWMEKDILRDLVRVAPYRWEWEKISRNSPEGRKKLAEFHSDKKDYWMNYKGPSWFRKEFGQKPYKVRAKAQLQRYLRDPDYEVVVESMPHLPYWL